MFLKENFQFIKIAYGGSSTKIHEKLRVYILFVKYKNLNKMKYDPI